MKLKSNMFTFLLIALSLSFSQVVSLSCELELTCKQECSNLLLKDGMLNTQSTPFVLSNANGPSTTENNIQYTAGTFTCEPGDTITFKNTPYNHGTISEGGFIGSLKIGTGANQVSFNSYDTSNNIFTCNPSCSLTDTETLSFFTDSSTPHSILKLSINSDADITIKIPYKVDVTDQSFINLKDSLTFSFLITPKITDADTSRIKVKITSIPNSDYATLQVTGETNTISNGKTIDLSNTVEFQPKTNKYGTFTLEYKVIAAKEELSIIYSITFNVCYKFCKTCYLYNSYNPSDYKCIDCIDDSTDINGLTYFVENQAEYRCFSLEEIYQDFSNYYDSGSQIYKRCDNSCKTCINSADICKACNKENLFYFVEGLPTTSSSPKKC